MANSSSSSSSSMISNMISAPDPALQDLKLTFHESTLIHVDQPKDETRLFLSNIDQILNYNVPNASFFHANTHYPPSLATHRLKSALHKLLLGPYHFMAGRLKLDHHTGRLHIHCNGAGAGFVAASSHLSLHDIGDLARPNLGFQQLALQSLPPNLLLLNNNNTNDHHDQPLCILQVTSFKCGGFAIGMSVNHILLDGLSAKDFTLNLASQAFDDDKPLAVVPFLDRSLLSARSPPCVTSFTHPEFYKPEASSSAGPPVFDCKKEDLEFRVFKLTPTDINILKEQAKTKTETQQRISSFNIIAALVWRCKALSCKDGDKVSTLLNVIDLRSRLTNPPLPSSYCGNAVLVAYALAKREEISEKLSFAEAVKMVSEGPKRMTDEYARSVIDWLEINKGLPCGEYMVSSWLQLGFDQVVYPWGKPVHSGPVVNHRKDICWIFPTVEGVNALVSLPEDEMKRFESEFHSFIARATAVVGGDKEEEEDMNNKIPSVA